MYFGVIVSSGLTQWLSHQLPSSACCLFAVCAPAEDDAEVAALVVVAGVAAAEVVGAAAADVCPPLPPSACSLAPKSVPQFPVYHVMTCWFCDGSVQKASQMPLGDECRLARYPDWQKQAHVAWLALAVPLHACAAWLRRVHDCAQAGSPWAARSCAEAMEDVRRAKRVVKSIVGNMAAG
jgi:hypothetical protein